MRMLDVMHRRFVFGPRVERIAGYLARLIPEGTSILDVGCGDGAVARAIMDLRSDLRIRGVEVVARAETQIPVELFDGTTLPFEPDRFDTVLLVDVLHHLDDPTVLLREAARVARGRVVIKDHLRHGFLAHETLRFMDWVGNARFDIPLPNTYWTRTEWDAGFEDAGLRVAEWTSRLRLYPPPASWLFDRCLHFAAVLEPKGELPPADSKQEEP